MDERELRAKQDKLMADYNEWYERQAEFDSDSSEWHDCEHEKEQLLEECDRLRIPLETGCCE